jgi:hypothetical protein
MQLFRMSTRRNIDCDFVTCLAAGQLSETDGEIEQTEQVDQRRAAYNLSGHGAEGARIDEETRQNGKLSFS